MTERFVATVVQLECGEYEVRISDERNSGPLAWGEVIEVVTELVHPKLGEPRMRMLTPEEWRAWREYLHGKAAANRFYREKS
jgi:hypothetical protein